MELRQRTELRHLLVPELNQSLKILALSLMDVKALVEAEMTANPFLEEAQTPPLPKPKPKLSESHPYRSGIVGEETEGMYLAVKKVSLQDILLRQLGMFADTDEELKIGQEIIGNIDENGYLKTSLEDIALTLKVPLESAQHVLRFVQQCEPAGVAARSVQECLLIQLELSDEKDPLLRKIIESHLEDVAKKNYSHIAKALQQPMEIIEPLIKKLHRLDPKPGRNYSVEETQHIVPDIIISEKGDDLEISINDEDIPTLNINKDYKKILKDKDLDPKTKEYMAAQLQSALALLRAVFRRKSTLRRIVDVIVEIQQEAVRRDFSHLKPLVFREVAEKIKMHESTVSRAIMNKYVKLPYGVVALKDFFSTSVQDSNGLTLSSKFVFRRIKELVEQENKKHPLSDQEVSNILLKQHDLKVPRRTVTKYREELKILSSTYRRER